MGEIALPDPSPVLDLAKIDVGAVLVRLEKVEDIAEAEEYRRRAQALASYLADRDPGPANRIANMAAVRIGELLGPAEMGRPKGGKSDRDQTLLDSATRIGFYLRFVNPGPRPFLYANGAHLRRCCGDVGIGAARKLTKGVADARYL